MKNTYHPLLHGHLFLLSFLIAPPPNSCSPPKLCPACFSIQSSLRHFHILLNFISPNNRTQNQKPSLHSSSSSSSSNLDLNTDDAITDTDGEMEKKIGEIVHTYQQVVRSSVAYFQTGSWFQYLGAYCIESKESKVENKYDKATHCRKGLSVQRKIFIQMDFF